LKSDREYLDHIREEIDFILGSSRGLEKKSFMEDPLLKRAFVRSIEIIGEASKSISDDLKRKHPDIEWKKITGARDRLIHGYFSIDYEIVWDIVVNKIPELKTRMDAISLNE
jgi:uncharacterized protein with HEPN domain